MVSCFLSIVQLQQCLWLEYDQCQTQQVGGHCNAGKDLKEKIETEKEARLVS